ncbi:MAG: YebC/PmpR family DNA-binding transcriptional regulator [Bacteroidetes bacterium]|nr:YebC/PmpR family DNA-binding transcriptional regulator [Bacteroidota bacterium]
MSGHSKWSTIKRKKGAADAKRSRVFSRISKEITIAVKDSGNPDPETNPRLRLAIQNAKGVNMPKDNIDRAISKAGKDSSALQEFTFEGYLPHGVAVFIECLSDNNNRTISNIRAVFNKRGGNLGINGSLSFLFERKGIFTIPKSGIDPEEFELELIDAGAEDIENEGDVYIVYTAMEDFGSVQKRLDKMNIEPENAELQRIPNDTKQLSLQDSQKIMRIIEEFEEDDDVQNVYHNLELTEELLASL